MAESPSARRRILVLLGAAVLGAMSLWFTASAAAGELARIWSLSDAQVGALTAAVQIGFVLGTALAALLNLADVLPSRGYFGACAVLGAAANATILLAPGYGWALASRVAVGLFLAGVYPPAMKMVATWYRRRRGLAIGTLIGAITLATALPYLLRALPGVELEGIVLGASVAAVGGGLIVVVGYRDGPHVFVARPFSLRLVGEVATHRPTRLATAGYLGHMWELYAMWTWLPAYLAASAAARLDETRAGPSPEQLALVAASAIAFGALGCIWGGWEADRTGRARLVIIALAGSGACAVLAGLGFGASLWLLTPLVWAWGFFVVADSAQFSALVTEVAPEHAVGTALTLQTCLGFLLTMGTIQAVPVLARTIGWSWAFPMLALGPAAGIVAMRAFQRLRVQPR